MREGGKEEGREGGRERGQGGRTSGSMYNLKVSEQKIILSV